MTVMRLAPALALFLGALFVNSSDYGGAIQRGWASTMQTSTTAPAKSGLEGRTIALVGSGAEGGATSKHVGSMEFTIVPIDGDNARFDAAIYVTSERDGSFKVALPSGQYRIVSMDEARDPVKFKHMRKRPPMTLRKQTVLVRRGAYTEVDVVFVGEAP